MGRPPEAQKILGIDQPNAAMMRRHAFTLPQLLLVLVVVSFLSLAALSIFTRARKSAHRADCDLRLKTLTITLDAFREENGRYPEHLDELLTRKYLPEPAMLKCPADPRPTGSYDDYYLMRAARDSGELPILCCPFCSNTSEPGLQAFKGRYTKQFTTQPAYISQIIMGTVERPGDKPFAAKAGMKLLNGDILRTDPGGSAVVDFADGSRCNMTGSSQITFLQSFVAGRSHAPLYTLIRQAAGEVNYIVKPWSKFDVGTPTATASALGTDFRIRQDAAKQWWLQVSKSKVQVSDLGGRDIIVAAGENAPVSDIIPVTVTSQWTFLGDLEPSMLMALVMPAGTSARPSAPVVTRTRIKTLRSDWRLKNGF